MHHKRGRAKARRAGCLLCKPNKLGQGMENKAGHYGFSKVRKEIDARRDIRDETKWPSGQLLAERPQQVRFRPEADISATALAG